MIFSLDDFAQTNQVAIDAKLAPLRLEKNMSSLSSSSIPKALKLKSAGYSIGKQADNCEDAFFVSARGFGVADGVSGWNDYGFSSHAFSN